MINKNKRPSPRRIINERVRDTGFQGFGE